MANFFIALKNKKTITVLFGIGLAVLFLANILSIFFTFPNIDEGYIGEWCYRLWNEGLVRCYIIEDLGLKAGNQIFGYHKLYTIMGSVIVGIFGLNLYALRIFSTFFLVLFIFLLYRFISNRIGKTEGNYFFFTSLFLLLGNTFIADQGLIARPELTVMFFGFASYFFLVKSFENKSYAVWLSGMFAGLAAFSHLNGIVFILAGGLVLLLKTKNIKEPLKFSVPIFVILFFYFWDINSKEKLDLFIYQWTNEPNLVIMNNSFFMRLVNEQQRYFHNLAIIPLSIGCIVSILFVRKKISQQFPYLLTYFLILVVSFALLSHGKTPKYLLLFFPYLILVFTVGITAIKTKYHLFLKAAILVAYFSLNIAFFIDNVNFSLPNLEKRNKELAQFISDENSKIVAAEWFVFGTIDKYNIVGELTFKFYCNIHNREQEKNNPVSFLNFCAENNCKYIVADYILDRSDFWKNPYFTSLQTGDKVQGYEVKRKSSNELILKLMD